MAEFTETEVAMPGFKCLSSNSKSSQVGEEQRPKGQKAEKEIVAGKKPKWRAEKQEKKTG